MNSTPLSETLADISERLSLAAQRTGRSAGDIRVVAVTKMVGIARIEEAYSLGLREFGENYVQEFVMKAASIAPLHDDIKWHFIGHLQTNKVREVVGKAALIHSVDSVHLVNEIAKRSRLNGSTTQILLQVKLDPADTKYGVEPEQMPHFVEQVFGTDGIALIGLMGMAPFSENPEEARPCFRRLRQLFDDLPHECRQILSMGMTGDFEVAIEEGANLVRIGSGLFGKRSSQ